MFLNLLFLGVFNEIVVLFMGDLVLDGNFVLVLKSK